MGLDIHAASHLYYRKPLPTNAEVAPHGSSCREGKTAIDDLYFVILPNQQFDRQLAGTEPGLYGYTSISQHLYFRAGSYAEYQAWRAELCRFATGHEPEEVWAEPDDFEGLPFVELIHFTDCAGRIGTWVAGKIAADFRAYTREAEAHANSLTHGANWFTIYQQFAHAFELACQDGVLEFC